MSARDSDRTVLHSHSSPEATSDLTSTSEKTSLAEVLCLGKVTLANWKPSVRITLRVILPVFVSRHSGSGSSVPHIAWPEGRATYASLLSAHTLSDNDSCHSLTAEFQMLKTKAQGFLLKSSQ